VGILPGHAALLAEPGAGKLSYTASGQRRWLTVLGGWPEVASDHVRVLANGAVPPATFPLALAQGVLESK
jgi:F0F1-type ATP synthase epsilon subunit